MLSNKAALRGVLTLAMLGVFVWQGCPSPDDPGVGDPVPETILFATPDDGSVACYRIPALETVNGVLLAAIDERVPSCGDLRHSRDINILLRRSMDGGFSWSDPARVFDYPDGIAASDASFIVDHERGRVFMLVNVMDHDEAPGEYRFHIIHSDDAGASWSAPRDITDEVAPVDWRSDFKFITSGHGTQAPDGTLLHTVVNLQRGVFVLMSEDAGASWSLAPSPVTPGDESKIVAFNNGRWMVNSRVANAGHRWVHVSKDRGQTWDSRPDSALVDPAVNASLIQTEEGLLYVGANHPAERRNLVMRLSTDDGLTWSPGTVIHDGSAAYVSAAALPDGDVGLFYERNEYAENVFSIIPTQSLR